MVTGSYSILARWRDYFSQLLNVHGVHDVRQTETHTAEPLVPEPSAFEVELAIEKLKNHKSPGINQIAAELIKEGVEQVAIRSINLLFLFGIKRNFLRSGRSQSLYLSIRRGIKEIVVTIGAYHICQLRTKHCPASFSQGKLHMHRKLLGIINVDSDATGRLLITYSAFVKCLRKNGNKMKQFISSL